MGPLEVIILLSSVYDGGKVKLVGSGFTFSDFASVKELVCTGDKGAKSGEEVMEAGGGVDNGKLEGVLPAAAFLSICNEIELHKCSFAAITRNNNLFMPPTIGIKNKVNEHIGQK